MTIQTFAAGQTLTASQMNTLQASDFNFTKNVQTGTAYTLVATDRGKLLEFSNSGSIALTIPTSAAVTFEIGDRVDVLLASTGTITIGGAPGVSVAAEGGITTISSQWTRVTLIKRTTDDWVITGGSGEVQTAEIEDGAITEAKLATGAVTSDKILDGTIVNADINASAAIAHSKLENATAGQVLLGTTTTGVVTATTISGDITINGAGVASIAANSVALGTDTTGNYMSDITAGTGLSVSHTAGEGSSATVSLAGLGFTTSSAAYTLALTDNNNMVEITATSAVDVTVPPNSTVSWPAGTQIVVFQRGTGKVRILEGAGVTILSTPGKYLRAQNSGATLVRRDTNVWILFGDLSAT